MKRTLLSAALTFSLTAALLHSQRAEACTNPEKEAEKPTVEEGGGSNPNNPGTNNPGGGTNNPGGGNPFEEGGGSGGGSGTGGSSGGGSSNPGGSTGGGSGSGTGGTGSGSNNGGGGFNENPGSGSGGGTGGTGSGSNGGGTGTGGTGSGSNGGIDNDEDTDFDEVAGGGDVLRSNTVRLSWSPGKDVDADPNNKAFFSHGGHEVQTRVVVKDTKTGKVVVDELVDQFDYANAKQGSKAAALTSLTKKLANGRYEAKVQSVFSRHDEIKYGLNGKWIKTSSASSAPDIADSVTGVRFVVATSAGGADALTGSDAGVAGGCSSAAGLSSLALLTLGALTARRRRRE